MSYMTRAGLNLSFVGWMFIAVPLVLVLLALTWWWLLRCYPPPVLDWAVDLPNARLTGRGTWVVLVALLTFAVWVTEPFHGIPAPAAAALPVTLFFASAIITRDDVNSLDWDVLILIAGGLALGFTLQATQLDARLAALVPSNAPDWTRLSVLAGATLLLGTFFSNTAIASMLIPVAVVTATLATTMGVGTYVVATAFVASLCMALPVSTPPNAMAYGSGELTSRDFLRVGGLIGLAGTIAIIALAIVWTRITR
jgi:sodium-dependent dicarboxylate transporter 2/3/5